MSFCALWLVVCWEQNDVCHWMFKTKVNVVQGQRDSPLRMKQQYIYNLWWFIQIYDAFMTVSHYHTFPYSFDCVTYSFQSHIKQVTKSQVFATDLHHVDKLIQPSSEKPSRSCKLDLHDKLTGWCLCAPTDAAFKDVDTVILRVLMAFRSIVITPVCLLSIRILSAYILVIIFSRVVMQLLSEQFSHLKRTKYFESTPQCVFSMELSG